MDPQSFTYLLHCSPQKAFCYLYDKYAAPLRYFASKYLNDDILIEDLIQDAFMALFEKRNDFHEENSVKGYLYRVIRNACIDKLRHNKTEQKVNSLLVQNSEQEEFFLNNIIETEVFQAIQSVFQELSPACREVYQLSLDGKSHEEISQQLGISINTVKKHKNNANHYMREKLKLMLSLLINLI